jgi:hypothetical protein
MIVGSNERLFAWMDEGFNTFINSLSSKILIMVNTKKIQLICIEWQRFTIKTRDNYELSDIYEGGILVFYVILNQVRV